MTPLLILRPEPGASATARAAAGLGLTTIVAPLFLVRPLAWSAPPPAGFDALVLTSGHAVRQAGPQLALYRELPVHAVGKATASMARAAGFADVTTGDADANALFARITAGSRLLHLCGRERRPPQNKLQIREIPVYAAEAVETLLAAARDAVSTGPVAMLHSPRAASLFGTLTDQAGLTRDRTAIVAISAAAAQAAGIGWKSVAAAPSPSDAAMLAIARELCENDAP